MEKRYRDDKSQSSSRQSEKGEHHSRSRREYNQRRNYSSSTKRSRSRSRSLARESSRRPLSRRDESQQSQRSKDKQNSQSYQQSYHGRSKYQGRPPYSNYSRRQESTRELERKFFSKEIEEYDPVKVGFKNGRGVDCHDRALERAAQAKYEAPRTQQDTKSSLFICGLKARTTERQLSDYFDQYGKVKESKVVRDKVTGASKGYAFIEFYDKEHAFSAYKDGNKCQIDGAREVVVDIVRAAKQPNFKPRRLGGGYGGELKGSQIRFGGRDRPFF